MDNKAFKEEVYRKYDFYKNVRNDDFYTKHHYKKNSTILFSNKVACLLLICILISGVVYATTYYVKNIWKEPETYTYEEEKKVTEEDIENSISEEDAKKIGLKTLEDMGMEIGNIKESYINKEPSVNKIEWVIITDNDLEIRINAKTGELYSFSNNKLLNKTNNKEVTEDEALSIANDIYKNLSYQKNYEFNYMSNIGEGKWQADFSVKYNDIFNPYQCVRITFIAETKELIMLNLFDYEFENNPFEITEEDSIKIVENIYGKENISDISAKKDIQMMNTMIYQKDNQSDSKEFRTENLVRNVWNVKITESEYGFTEYYYVDATTGEIIGGDRSKVIY